MGGGTKFRICNEPTFITEIEIAKDKKNAKQKRHNKNRWHILRLCDPDGIAVWHRIVSAELLKKPKDRTKISRGM
jgi:hypothetical protein